MLQGLSICDGRFQMARQLGRGGFGETWQAVDRLRNEWVAIKFSTRIDNPRDAALFEREARNLHRLAAVPEVVDFIDAGSHEGRCFIIMEYCDGGSLTSWVNNRQDHLTILGALATAAIGLKAIHGAGGFHRDIKPDNILMKKSADGFIVKLGDLGLARVPDSNSQMTAHGWGTPLYMAPELKTGPYSAAADMYSFGVTALQLFTGSTDPAEAQRVQLPAGVPALLLRLVDVDPSKRPTAHEVAVTLARIIEAPVPAVAIKPQPGKAAPPRQVRQPANGAGVVVGFLLVAGLLALLAKED